MKPRSEMQVAEKEIREIMAAQPSEAMCGLLRAYTQRADTEKDSFVAVLISHLAIPQAPSIEA